MAHINNSDIAKEIRTRGVIMRTIMPYMDESSFKKANKFMKLIKGKCGRNLVYEQVWIQRDESLGIKEDLRVCVYKSKSCSNNNVPGLLWIHGGGYCIGTPEMCESTIREFIEATDCVVVSPDYCLAMEKPYPAAMLDCYTALTWMVHNAQQLGIDTSKIIVGGESAGGGLAAATCIYARDKGEVSIKYQIPLYPMLDCRMITPSSQNNDAPFWNSKSNENAWRLYLGDLYGGDEIPVYASPALLTDYSNLPPAYTFIGDIEPFHDETINYFENLKKAGIKVEYDLYQGCYHGFDIVNPKATVTRQAHSKMIEQLINVLND